jgi:hypothetical protein
MWKAIVQAGAIALLVSACGSSIEGDPNSGGNGGGADDDDDEPDPIVKTCPVAVRTASTIRVLSGPQPCSDGPNWAGWNCVLLESTANNNGAVYQLEVRWNLVGQTVRGSWTWLTGAASDTFFRDGQNLAIQAQDQLATQDQVRSIETRFVGGRGASPRNGDVNLAVVYVDMYHWLVDNGVSQGVIGHFGSSAGAATGAAAVANHKLHELLDGIVYGAGPTFIVLDTVCTPSTDVVLRRGLDDRTWVDLTGQRPCEQMRPDLADPSFDCMSILGSEADLDYPNTIVAVLLGDQDPDLGFIEPQARLYVSMITAQQTSVDVLPATPHNVLKTTAGLAKALEKIRAIVDAG